MQATADWLDQNAGYHDRFLLVVDEFDPHEPFDTPEPYASMYDDSWEGQHLIWPPYVDGGVQKGVITERQARQVRASYGGKLTMIDAWFGKVLDAIDRNGLWNDTAVIVCTDHGHYLGEKDIWGKPGVPAFEPMSHTPLMIAWPGVAPGATSALTTTVDIFTTLAEVFGVQPKHRTHGRSLAPLLRGEANSMRDYVLCGVWGRQVNLIRRRLEVLPGPRREQTPPFLCGRTAGRRCRCRVTQGCASRLRMPAPSSTGCPAPPSRSSANPIAAGDALPYWAIGDFSGNHLYNLKDDPHEEKNLAGTDIETGARRQAAASAQGDRGAGRATHSAWVGVGSPELTEADAATRER